MNLLELRTQLTNMVGDYALVGQDTTDPTNIVPDYSTDGAAQTGTLNRLLNDAVRTVVDKLPSLFDQESYLCRLALNEYRLLVPNLRKFDRAELWQTGQCRGELEKSTFRTLRQDYGENWEDQDTGEPAFIARGQLRSRQPNLMPPNYYDDIDDTGDNIPAGYLSDGTVALSDGSGFTFPAATLSGFTYYFSSATSGFGESNLTGPLSLSFRVQYTGPRFSTLLRLYYKGAATDSYTDLATITEPGLYTFPIDASGVAAIAISPGTNGSDQLAPITVDRLELRQTGTDSLGVSPHATHFVTMPPADGSYEVRVYGWYYPDLLLEMFDSNEVTETLYRLVLLLGATQWATDRGHEGLTNHWGTQANRELLERLRDIGNQQLADLEDSEGRIDWID